ncbi:MAG: Uracil-DNA glycosylase [Candidatus Yanofskybacteria bacterium GW2011_GWA1_39_13]|uniref:Type-4 uracil-DNA glycosylase n=1 Tax=Yanofskybacteria sp. (strain GW2011_GWA1_39_13) TaxID=1619019 RepID=A0A0G0ME99_YANXG|nr:MAG: Uracil-DNA glycosylase [Candidatus Yanofskybacteria bacterium GW2011_GWA1_39_13]
MSEETQKLNQVNDSLKRKFKDRKLVFGSGFPTAKIVFVGEAPGQDEENEGKPIAGYKQKLLYQLLKTAGINKNKVYFTNVLKYYPSTLKVPTAKEIKSYVPFLKEELKTINPLLVVTLGNMALNGIGMRQPLDNVHGKTFNLGSYELLPTFHPDHALKDPQVKTLLQLDFVKLKKLLDSKEA